MQSTPDASASLAAASPLHASRRRADALTSAVDRRFSPRRYAALLHLYWYCRANGDRAIDAWETAVDGSGTADKPQPPTVHRLWFEGDGWRVTHETEAPSW